MAALWESSTRSLFVKTVWKDGHRHVLLQEEAAKTCEKSMETPKRRANSKSATKKSFAPPLRVPSVKLRLKKFMGLRIDSVKRNKAKKSSKKKKLEVSLDDRIEKIGKETEEIRLKSQYNENKYRKITKSYTIDQEDASKNSILANNYPIGTKLLQSDENFTSLSDRVLMWLDLATQNGSCSESMANFKRISFAKPRVITAASFPTDKPHFNSFERPKISFQRQYSFDCDEDSFSSDLEDESSDDSILKCNAINLSKGKIQLNEALSISEDEEKIDETGENVKHCCDKRQLHIFMPNLPQIFLEVDEVSVSKCSSIVKLDET